MPDVFKKSKQKSTRRLNGETPKWFKDWHGSEFMEVRLRVTGLLWLTGILMISALGCFGVMIADYFRVH